MPESSRAHHMHSSGLAQACFGFGLFGEITFKEIVRTLLRSGMVSKFSFCQGSFSYQLQQETRVYFLPDLVYIFPKNY
jgi:hypothetical protein